MSGRALFSDIRFWIVLFFLLRMYGITNPPLEIGHSWRQVTGTMVARNFLEVDNNILYPRIDDNQGITGIVGMEFPLLNYLIYLVSLVFGYTHWYGRLINLLISSVGIWYFYRIIKTYLDPRVAFYATLILLASVWFAFSRKTMPDTFCMAIMMMALFHGLTYLYGGKRLHLLLFILLGSAAALSKIPAVYLLGVLIVPYLDRQVEMKRRISLGGGCLVILLATCGWYFIWCPYLSETYGVWFNAGKPLGEGMKDTFSHAGEAAKRFYFDAICYSGFVVFLAGLVMALLKKERILLLVVAASTAVFTVYMFKSGYMFYHHNYYIVPYAPVMCLVAGYALSHITRATWRNLLTAFVMIEGILNQQHDLRIKDSELYKLELEAIADKVSAKNDLIVINTSNNPQQIYFTHRKGWSVDNRGVSDISFIKGIQEKGCRFIFVNRQEMQEKLTYPIVFENNFYTVYKL